MSGRGEWEGYALAAGGSALAWALAVLFAEWFGASALPILFLLPVTAAAWHGGWRPGALAAAFGVAGVVARFEETSAFAEPGSALLVQLGLYLFASAAIVLLGHARSVTRREASARQAEWRERLEVAERARAAHAERMACLERMTRVRGISYWRWDIASGNVERALNRRTDQRDARLARSFAIDEVWEQVPAEQRDDARATVQQALASGRNFSVTVPFTLVTGNVRWFEVRGAVAQDQRGKPTYVSAALIDIDHRKRSENDLRESEERFRTLADHAPVMLWGIDADGGILLNRECLRFTGTVTPPTSALEWWRATVHPDDNEEYIAHYTHAVAHRALFEAQVRLKRADGEYRWFKSIGTPRRAEDGSFRGYAGCCVDITEMKQYIAELARAERTLLDADRRKDEFLSSLSNELRNPLSPIRDAASVLAGSTPGQHRFERAREVINRQVAELARVLDQLTDVSHITQSNLELQTQRLDLRDVMEKALAGSRPLFDSKSLMVDVSLSEEPISVDADPERLAQVFAILFDNAAKYTDKGGAVSVRADQAGSSARVTVKDNGMGIAPERLLRVFDIFQPAPGASGSARKGLGIGLGLARRIVEIHGGQLQAHSAGVGRGSEFEVTLPLGATVEQESGRPVAAARTNALRILIADDLEDAAELLAVALRVGGNDVRIATDGVSALDTAAAFRPDVAVLDIGMPKLTGYEVARRLRREPWGEHMVLIALTGWGHQEDIRRALDVGFNYHMAKPVNIAQLQEVLEHLVGREAEDA